MSPAVFAYSMLLFQIVRLMVSSRIEFRMQRTATPTSPKTAIHMFVRPKAVSTRMRIFTKRAKTMFWVEMATVRRAMRMTIGMRARSSSMMTMSAASIAASEPIEPIAMPTSARASTGASLMPSPMKASSALSCCRP